MKQHQLIFHHALPNTQKTNEGYVLSWQGTALMGILNVTPDSFSDGGKFVSIDAAIKQATTMLEHDVKIIDIGGESSRPGAEPVSVKQELERVLPVIKLLKQLAVIISIDTRKPEVAFEAIKAGAHMVNDIGGLCDPDMLEVCVDAGVPAVIMHMQGEPQNMQKKPEYKDVVSDVFNFLQAQAELVLGAGLPSVMLDPGIGFGKTLEHNLELLRHLGASRKRMIDKIAAIPEASSRDPGSVAMHLHAASQGVAMVRVHNTYAHRQALKVWEAIYNKAEPV
jgi:dihydropteroate synthase